MLGDLSGQVSGIITITVEGKIKIVLNKKVEIFYSLKAIIGMSSVLHFF